MTLEEFVKDMETNGYTHVKLMASGEIAALLPMIGSMGLFMGLDEVGYRCWYSYPNDADATAAIDKWDGRGDPPGPWIKQKGRDLLLGPVDRNNPNL